MSEKVLPVEETDEKGVVESPKDSKKSDTGSASKKLKKSDSDKSSKSLSKEFNIVIKRKDIDDSFDMAAEKYSSEMKLDGFRKGKIPVEVVKSKYHEVIIDEVINKMIEEYTFKKIKEEKIPIISSPVVKDFEFKDGEDLKALVSVDLFPEIKIPDLDKIQLKIKKELLNTEKYDEAKQIKLILENNKRKQIVKERASKAGDFIEFKIQSQFADTKRMMPKKDSFFELKEEPHQEIGELYQDLIGKSTGDSFEINRKYPKDSAKKNWAGKSIKHYIEIKSVSEYVTPELDDQFLKSIGFSDEQSFKLKVKDEYSLQLDKQREQVITTEIREKLIELSDFSVPDSIVNEEVQRSQAQYAQILMTLPEDKRAEYFDTVKENAEKSIKFSFIIEEIKKQNDIKVENEDLEKEYKLIADANNIEIKEVRKYYMNKEQNESLRDTIGRKRTIDLLKEKIKIKEV